MNEQILFDLIQSQNKSLGDLSKQVGDLRTDVALLKKTIEGSESIEIKTISAKKERTINGGIATIIVSVLIGIWEYFKGHH